MRSGISEYVPWRRSRWRISYRSSRGSFVDPQAEFPSCRSIPAFVGARRRCRGFRSTLAHKRGMGDVDAVPLFFRGGSSPTWISHSAPRTSISTRIRPRASPRTVLRPNVIDEVYLDRLLAQCAERLSLLAAPSTLDRTLRFRRRGLHPAHRHRTAQRACVVLDVPHIWCGWSPRATLHSNGRRDRSSRPLTPPNWPIPAQTPRTSSTHCGKLRRTIRRPAS